MADQLAVNALQICLGSVDILRNHRKKKGQNAAEKYLCLTMWKGLGIPLFLFFQVTFNIFIHFLSPQTSGNLIFRKCGPQIVIFQLVFTPCKAEQPLRGMELQEKGAQKN